MHKNLNDQNSSKAHFDAACEKHERQMPQEQFDLSFVYSFNWFCPERAVKEAMKILLCADRDDNETEQDASENDAEKSSSRLEQEYVRRLLASNPQTPPHVLEHLAAGAEADVLERVAENPGTSPNTLARLAFDPAPAVRAAVSENQNTPVETMMMLCGDENTDVRYRLAEGYHVPGTVLEMLADEDQNPYVVARAKKTLRRIDYSQCGDDMKVIRIFGRVQKASQCGN